MNYFDQRIHQEMQLNKKDYTLKLKMSDPLYGVEIEKEISFLRENKFGDIEITPYDIDKHIIEYDHVDNRKTVTDKGADLDIFTITRIHPDRVTNGNKYYIPKSQGTYPFLTKEVCRAYDKKKELDTLYLTEGYLKAIATAHHTKLPFIGLGSISQYRNKEKELYADIRKVIDVCKVQNVVMYYDGDSRDLSKKALNNPKKNLTDRPYNFFSSALNLRNLIVDEDVNFYFATIKSDMINGNPKGIDDLILTNLKDILKITRNIKKKTSDKTFFHKIDLTGSLSKLKEYLNLKNVQDFWEAHRKTIGLKFFKFFGTEYLYNLEKDKLEIKMPEAAGRYLRIGDDYYERIAKPTIHNTYNNILSRRMKGTIRDDHGSKILKFIPKYIDFTLLPSHEDYKEIQDGFYNLYKPFTHEPTEGEFPNTIKYLKHIFSELGDNGYQYALDYIQLLYQKPTQVLPILCLVSEENATGKTMFAKWINEIFKGNCIIVGNSEISSDFNSYLLGKLLITIDESFLDKKLVIERIKSLATASTIPLTKKGKDTIEVDFFGKIILLSNNVDNFITANTNDTRYWVLTVPQIEKEKKDPDLLDKMIPEIPAFLYFLQKRTFFTENKDRAWFDPELLQTESLQKVINKSKPTVVKDLEAEFIEMFNTYRVKQIYLGLKDVQEIIFNKKINLAYVKEILTKHLKLIPQEKTKKYQYPIGIDDNDNLIVNKGNTTYYTFTPEMFDIDATDFVDIENSLPF